MSSIGHPCSTVQGSAQYLSLMKKAVVLLPCWTNNHYPMPGLNVEINLYKLALLPTPLQTSRFNRQSVTFTISLTIGCFHNRDHRHRDNRVIVQSVKLYSRCKLILIDFLVFLV